jgi:hypothetical protein
MGERVLTGTENGWRVMIGRQIALLAAMHFCNAPTLSPNIQYIGFFRHPPMFVMVTWKPVEHPCGLSRANCHKYLGVRLCCVILLCHIFDYYSLTTTSKLLNRIKTTLPRPVSTRNQRTTPAKTRETTHTTTVTTIRSTVLHTSTIGTTSARQSTLSTTDKRRTLTTGMNYCCICFYFLF